MATAVSRYYSYYSSVQRSRRRRQQMEKQPLGPIPIPPSEDIAAAKTARGNWVRFIKKVFEPEKEVLFTVVPRSVADTVYDALVDAGRMHEPGMGFIFVHEVRRATGWLTGDLKGAS